MNFLQKNHVKYGLILVAITAVCLLLMEVTGNNQSFDAKSPVQFFYMIVAPFIVWWVGLRAKRKELGNRMSYRQGFVEGVRISFVYALVSPFIFLAYYVFVNPSIVEYVRTAYRLAGASDAVVIGSDMVGQFVAAMVFGSIYAAIIAIFLRRR